MAAPVADTPDVIGSDRRTVNTSFVSGVESFFVVSVKRVDWTPCEAWIKMVR